MIEIHCGNIHTLSVQNLLAAKRARLTEPLELPTLYPDKDIEVKMIDSELQRRIGLESQRKAIEVVRCSLVRVLNKCLQRQYPGSRIKVVSLSRDFRFAEVEYAGHKAVVHTEILLPEDSCPEHRTSG